MQSKTRVLAWFFMKESVVGVGIGTGGEHGKSMKSRVFGLSGDAGSRGLVVGIKAFSPDSAYAFGEILCALQSHFAG
jgi:hypothetical protein